jgi:type II secretory pathway pseudopilin PulG
MQIRNGFTFIEAIFIIIILGILAVMGFPLFMNLSQNALQSSEDGVAGAVRSGVNNYYAESQIEKRTPAFPSELDSSGNGEATAANPLFGIVLANPMNTDWEKQGLTYTGPAGGVYNYYPQTGLFSKVAVPAGFTGYWPFGEGGGSSTQLGDFQANFVGNVGWTDGVDGPGLDFDGVDSFITVPDADIFDLTDQGTLAAWINMDSIPPFAGIIHKGDAADFSDEAYTLQFWSGNHLALGITDASNQLTLLQSSTVFQPGQLYHVAATWDSNGMKIYVNGQLDSFNQIAATAQNSDGNLNIGAQIPSYYNGAWHNLPFDGMVDEVMVYNQSLTEDQIQQYYNAYP